MVNLNFMLGGAGIAGGFVWANVGGTATVPAGGLPGQALPPIFDHDFTIENITTEMIGNNVVQGILSLPKKGHVKMTVDYRLYPEVLAILQGSTITTTGTTPTRTSKIRMKSGTLRPVFAYLVWCYDMANPLGATFTDMGWAAFNCIMTKDIDIKGEALKPDTKTVFEFDVFPDATNQEFVIQFAHETAATFTAAGQPQCP